MTIACFSAIKKSLQVCHSGDAGSKDGDRYLPYYPNRYFHRQVVNWMVENRQKVFVYMDSTLRAAYGIADPTASHGGPFSYREYLDKLLKRGFWGEEIVLWAVSMMWGLKITVLNYIVDWVVAWLVTMMVTPKASWSLAIYCSIIGGHLHSFSVVTCIFSATERSGQRCDGLRGHANVSLQDLTSR